MVTEFNIISFQFQSNKYDDKIKPHSVFSGSGGGSSGAATCSVPPSSGCCNTPIYVITAKEHVICLACMYSRYGHVQNCYGHPVKNKHCLNIESSRVIWL